MIERAAVGTGLELKAHHMPRSVTNMKGDGTLSR
jgi:hypothetical protein